MRYSMTKPIIAGFIFAFITALYLVIVVANNGTLWFDNMIASILSKIFPASTHTFFSMVSGSNWVIIIAALATILFLWIKKRDYFGMAIVVLTVLVSKEASELLKGWVGRERPESSLLMEAETLSFPSGHSTVGFAMFMLISYFVGKEIHNKLGKWVVTFGAVLIILLIGVSRIVLQAHYPSDVIAGYAFGFMTAYLSICLYEMKQSGTFMVFDKNRAV